MVYQDRGAIHFLWMFTYPVFSINHIPDMLEHAVFTTFTQRRYFLVDFLEDDIVLVPCYHGDDQSTLIFSVLSKKANNGKWAIP